MSVKRAIPSILFLIFCFFIATAPSAKADRHDEIEEWFARRDLRVSISVVEGSVYVMCHREGADPFLCGMLEEGEEADTEWYFGVVRFLLDNGEMEDFEYFNDVDDDDDLGGVDDLEDPEAFEEPEPEEDDW